ncbi:MAG: MBL fold metallo-hydrolase [Xanthomonadales bacterium]|nr:MBL fold metallo-hydrolase [Xanthomonadales bacterium]
MTRPSLDYPLDSSPAPGTLLPVTDGIAWTRSPLPMQLDHINLWLLREDQGWSVVDTGMNTSDARNAWDQLADTQLGEHGLQRVIVTHMHPDHAGLAGWLVQRWHCDFYMSRTDYLMCRVLASDPAGEPPRDAIRFYRAAGFDQQTLDIYSKRFGGFGKAVGALPNSYHRLRHGEVLESPGHRWTLVEGNGHAPEHICLLDRDSNILIAGDQLLPTISPNVSVWPTEPEANPLADWIESCGRLARLVDSQTLVLPAHGKPFRGAPERLHWLIDQHLTTVEQLADACHTPRRVVDLIPMIFTRKLDPINYMMATGETLAHLHYLIATGGASRELDGDGVAWYRST